MTRKKTEEKKADDSIEHYKLHIPLGELVVEGVIETGNEHAIYLDVKADMRDLKSMILNCCKSDTMENMETMLEQYVELARLEFDGINSLPVNLQNQPELKEFIKKTE